jgi:hypothetical protein
MSNPFEEAKQVLTATDGVEVKNPWMVMKILSFNPATAMLAIKFNHATWKVPSKYTKHFFKCFPKFGRAPFLRYAAKKKEKEAKLVSKVSKHFCVSKYHADQIIDLYRLQGISPERFFGLKKGE